MSIEILIRPMSNYSSIQHNTHIELTTLYAQATEVQGFSADDAHKCEIQTISAI